MLCAHIGEQVMLNMVAEVEVQAINDGQCGHTHRVFDRVIRLGHRAHEVVGGDVAHDQSVSQHHGNCDDEQGVERSRQDTYGDPQG